MTYPPGTRMLFRRRADYALLSARLTLHWELHLDPISDDYTPDATPARELWNLWVQRLATDNGWDSELGNPWVPIYWYICDWDAGICECAPFERRLIGQSRAIGQPQFLFFYSLPVLATGEPVNWLRLPVADKLWDATHADKGGFIQSATGWKPSPYQSVVDLTQFVAALGYHQ